MPGIRGVFLYLQPNLRRLDVNTKALSWQDIRISAWRSYIEGEHTDMVSQPFTANEPPIRPLLVMAILQYTILFHSHACVKCFGRTLTRNYSIRRITILILYNCTYGNNLSLVFLRLPSECGFVSLLVCIRAYATHHI